MEFQECLWCRAWHQGINLINRKSKKAVRLLVKEKLIEITVLKTVCCKCERLIGPELANLLLEIHKKSTR